MKTTNEYNTRFKKASDGYIEIYTGGSETLYPSFSVTFNDDSGLNPNWNATCFQGCVNYVGESEFKYATEAVAFTNGSTLDSSFKKPLKGTESGNNFIFASQDTWGIISHYFVRIYNKPAPDDALTLISVGE